MKPSWVLVILVIFIIAISGLFLSLFLTHKNDTQDIKAALDQEITEQPLAVYGRIPEWLQGTFVRNGPIPVHKKNQKIVHWFDGPAMLHAFSFQAGKVKYTNKFLRTDVYKKIFIEGNLNYGGFASESHDSLLEKLKNFFRPHIGPVIQNANVNLTTIAGQPVALTETPLPVQFDLNTLETLGALPFQDTLPQEDIFESAHPQQDVKAGNQINYLVEYGRQSYYVVYRYNPTVAKREIIAKINVEKPAYMHSFALTPQYVILVEFPLLVNPIDLMLSSKGFIKNFHWYPEQGTNFIIINRETGQRVKTIHDKTPFFAFHHVNAFEEGDNIILDIVTYPDAKTITEVADYGDPDEPYNMESQDPTQTLNKTKLVRYTLSPKNNTVSSKILFDAHLEFPRINGNYNTQPYRFAYVVDARALGQPTDLRPIYKVDTTLETKNLLWQEPGTMPGEPVFIPNPQGTTEDDGVVVTIVLDIPKHKAFLLLLDGKSFTEIGRLYAPHIIPEGLHGQFFSAKNQK